MPLPKQVQDAKDKAEELQKQLVEGDAQEANVEGEQQGQDVGNTEQSVDNGGDAQEDVKEEDWEHKYKTLQGMMNKQNEDNKAALSQRDANIANLQNMLATLDTQNQEQDFGGLTEEEMDEYGESIDVMRRALGQEMTEFNNRIKYLEAFAGDMREYIVPQMNDVAQQQKDMKTESFLNELVSYVPDAIRINRRPDFQQWLLDIDKLSGTTRQTLLENAERNHDVVRVAAFFQQWMAETGHASNGYQETVGELERQIAPGQSRGFSPQFQQQTVRSFSRKDIKEFYNDISKGRYKGRDEERAKIEKEIHAAIKEGRVS